MKNKSKKQFDRDFVRAMKKGSRDEYGFEAPKIHSCKKDYNRKSKYKNDFFDED